MRARDTYGQEVLSLSCTSGVPQHLRSAYGGGKLVPAGQIIVMRGEVESIQDPEWWNQDAVMAVMDHVCEKMVSFPRFLCILRFCALLIDVS